MINRILSPSQVHAAIAQGASYELGVKGSTKVGFGEFVSYVELAPIKVAGEVLGWCWLIRDEAGDIVDFVEAAEADLATAEGYTPRED